LSFQLLLKWEYDLEKIEAYMAFEEKKAVIN